MPSKNIYVAKNRRLDPQTETTRVAALLSANSLIELKSIEGRHKRREDHVKKSS